METGNPHILNISGKNISIYISPIPDTPVIYLNTFAEEGGQVYQALQETGCPPFTLVAISGLLWNHDMSPWAIQQVTKNNIPFTGGADAYLKILTEEVIPEVEQIVPGRSLWRGLAGYSLAGLFALYSMYQTEAFARFASASGSLWFPEFKEYAIGSQMKTVPEAIYISLGDKECRTRNLYMKTVQEHTEEIVACYRERGIDIIYKLNPGNHFQDTVRRMASGIAWILAR